MLSRDTDSRGLNQLMVDLIVKLSRTPPPQVTHQMNSSGQCSSLPLSGGRYGSKEGKVMVGNLVIHTAHSGE